MSFEKLKPMEIESRSFEIITSELETEPDPLLAPIVKRVIHTTADFDYEKTLCFTPGAVEGALEALKKGCTIVTDTNMARSGINKKAAKALGVEPVCFMADPEIARQAKLEGGTRACASMEHAATLPGPLIFAVGNAPTALFTLCDLIDEGKLSPELIIGVPVGFVNVVEAKERLLDTPVPSIVNRGRKGGSGVAAAIVNALMYMITRG